MSLMQTAPNNSPNSTSRASIFDGVRRYLSEKEQREHDLDIARWVKSEYARCKSARQSQERTWYSNIEMYNGNHWAVWGVGTLNNRLLVPKAPPWRTRLTINRIRPIIRTEIARMISQKPNASVVPASSEDQDLFAAQAAEQVWESTYTNKGINKVLRRAAFWTAVCGVGYIKDWYDDSKTDPKTGDKGDFCIQQITPFHIFVPDLMEEEIENQPYVIHAEALPVGKAYMMYPELEGKLNPSVQVASEIVDNTRLKVAINNNPDAVLVLEMWLKPGAHKNYPNGGMVRIVEDYVVENHEDGIPYDHGEYPFTKFDHIPTGKFYSESVIVDLREIQREYNRTRSQIVESKNRMAKPQLMAPEGSIDPKKITSEPGQVILYKQGFNPPQPLPLQGLPNYVVEELNRIVVDMEDISAQHQVSKGSVPPGVTAATAISYLQEKDDSLLAPTYASIEEGMEKLARHVLNNAVQFWTLERTVKVTGVDGSFDAMVLKGSELKNGTDIRMEAGSALPTSKAARQAFLMDMMDRGFIPPEKGLEMMEIGGVQKIYEQLRIDERQAQRENLRMKSMNPEEVAQHYQMTDQFMQMKQGMEQAYTEQNAAVPPELAADLAPDGSEPGGNLSMLGADPAQLEQQMELPGAGTDMQTGEPLMPGPLVPVNTWDNHAVHIDVHNRFRKTQAFELLPEEIKRLFEEHVSTHAMALTQSAGAVDMSGGMGVPQLSQGEGGQMPPEMMGMG